MTAFPTLEDLFGPLDYCACEDCKSVLSPAAYLIDLLRFINLKKYDHLGKELPVTYEKNNPIDVLLKRRPDIEYIHLTCENTNTILPYIDLVNEILEFYVTNHTLTPPGDEEKVFHGFNVDNITSEELLANPQNVNEEAYTTLKGEVYPFNLPFDQRLEALRLFYEYSKVKLYEAMEKLRVNDDFETGVGVDMPPYAWRDIYNEFLDISPGEYAALTDSVTKKLPAYFGENDVDEDFNKFNNNLLNAKTFCKRTGITYDDLIKLIQTQFINPNKFLITKLQKLNLSFKDIEEINDGTLSDVDLEKKLPINLDLSEYGGVSVKEWIKNNHDKINSLILLFVPKVDTDCGFNMSELRYSIPDDDGIKNILKEIDYWRLLRFIRIWNKLGWTMEETDKVITALYKPGSTPGTTDEQKLDDGFKKLIVKVAHLKKIKEKLNLKKKTSLVDLLTLWTDIDTTGNNSLYARLFLNSSILRIDNVFKENGYGEYLQDPKERISYHLPVFQAAFNLTAQELSLILKDASFDDKSKLTLKNVSTIYRYSFLARALKLSVQEFLTLKTMSGIDPFTELEDINPNTLKFIERAQLIKQSDFKINTLSYLLQHEDVSGKSSPPKNSILSLAKMLKEGLVQIEQTQDVGSDPTGDIAKSKMTLVYESAVVDKFFGLLKGLSYSVDYSHPLADLELGLKKLSDKIKYDDFQKRLSYQGVMSDEQKTNFISSPIGTPSFKTAINELYSLAQNDTKDFFDKYADLKTSYNDYINSSDPEHIKMSKILIDFLPSLKDKLKHLLIKQTFGTLQDIDLGILHELMENQDVLESVGKVPKPAIEDFLSLELGGVSAQYFFADDTTGVPEPEEIIFAGIDFPKSQKLPPKPKISAIWKFYLDVPLSGNYNYYIETDVTSEVKKFSIDEKEILMDNDGSGIWKNAESIELNSGVLYLIELEIDKVKDKAILKWSSKGIGKESIPLKYLYPFGPVQDFSQSYLRILKANNIFEKLGMAENEILFFSTNAGFYINKKSFLNTISVTANPIKSNVVALFEVMLKLLYYVNLKSSMNIKDTTLVDIFKDPNVKDENGESILLKATTWDQSYLDILNHLKWKQSDLSDLTKFVRVYDALQIVKKFGVSPTDLLSWTTNQPFPATISAIKSTLKAKYDEDVWFDALRPINDNLRGQQRDALVSYALTLMQKDTNTKHIDTSDKLFEYFLIDVENDPCTKTSRIKQAISTVQLFIQRCLLNLENDLGQEVSPESIISHQWKWMKRYRIWEANRKIFLYPENWLEPELRDSKSQPYKDLEGELLQADITDELAEKALLTYLEKLDDISKLEICGMYLQENKDWLHVFGGTTGASRKYYYRRLENNRTWTPWEKVDLDIEGTPLLPLVWKNRLFLFWLNIVRKGSSSNPLPDAPHPDEKSPLDCSNADLNNAAQESIGINLSWSEYYNNKWQPRKTSDLNNPVELGVFNTGTFERKSLEPLSYGFDSSGFLVIRVTAEEHFKFFNKHTAPIKEATTHDWDTFLERRIRVLNSDEKKLKISYFNSKFNPVFEQDVLQNANFGNYNFASNDHPLNTDDTILSNPYEAPFFCQDGKCVFFVKPEEGLTRIADHEHFGIFVSIATKEPDFPKIWVKPGIGKEVLGPHGPWAEETPIFKKIRGDTDPVPVDFLDSNVATNKILLDNKSIIFGNANIGPMGSQYARLVYNDKIGKSNFETINEEGMQ